MLKKINSNPFFKIAQQLLNRQKAHKEESKVEPTEKFQACSSRSFVPVDDPLVSEYSDY